MMTFSFSTPFPTINNMMTSTSQASESKHPLLADRERLEEILDIMYAKIQKTLFPRNPRRRPRAETSGFINADDRERIREGAGFSADDVLSEAFLGLLEYSPERLKGTWESLAVTIAGNKAADAFRASTKGLRGTDHRPELRIVSGDAEGKGPDGGTGNQHSLKYSPATMVIRRPST